MQLAMFSCNTWIRGRCLNVMLATVRNPIHDKAHPSFDVWRVNVFWPRDIWHPANGQIWSKLAIWKFWYHYTYVTTTLFKIDNFLVSSGSTNLCYISLPQNMFSNNNQIFAKMYPLKIKLLTMAVFVLKCIEQVSTQHVAKGNT